MRTLLLLCKDESGDNAKQFKMLEQSYPYVPLGDRQMRYCPFYRTSEILKSRSTMLISTQNSQTTRPAVLPRKSNA